MKTYKRGISLIVLVVTIIVLAILASAVIISLSNANIISQANDAVNQYNLSQHQDALNLAYSDWLARNNGKEFTSANISELNYNPGEDYEIGIKNGFPVIVSAGAGHIWSRTGDAITCSHCTASYNIGDEIEYAHTGTEQSVTVGTDKTGKDPQTVTRENVSWIILGLVDESTLLIATKQPVHTTGLTIYGDYGYKYGEELLDDICNKLYGARSLKTKDINMLFNYNPSGGLGFDGEKRVELSNFTTKISQLSIYQTLKSTVTHTPLGDDIGNYVVNGNYWRIKKNGNYIYDIVQEEKDSEGNWPDDGDSTIDQANVVTQAQKIALLGQYGFANQWIADKVVRLSSSYNAYFGIGFIYGGPNSPVTCEIPTSLTKGDGTLKEFTCAIRPVVELSFAAPAKI